MLINIGIVKMKNTRKKSIKNATLVSFFVLLSAFSATSSFARNIDGKTVTIVHTGETSSVHTGKQCYFKVEGNSGWIYIPQTPAGVSNCEIVQSAFIHGKPVSLDFEPGTNDQVRYLCAALVGNC